jgi:hypothetical protein
VQKQASRGLEENGKSAVGEGASYKKADFAGMCPRCRFFGNLDCFHEKVPSRGILLTAKGLKTGGTGTIGAICHKNATNFFKHN